MYLKFLKTGLGTSIQIVENKELRIFFKAM